MFSRKLENSTIRWEEAWNNQNIKTPNGMEAEDTKNKKREFLAKEMSLPSSQWSKEFQEYILEKIAEKNTEKARLEQEVTENSPEEEQEKTFVRYLAGLDLSEENLRDKKILDLGCGEEGDFVRSIIDKGITSEVYGLDANVNENNIQEQYRGNILQGDFLKGLPIENADYVISVGAASNVVSFSGEDITEDILKNAVEALNEQGEVRIYPIQKAPPESGLEGVEESEKKWSETLQKLSDESILEYELRPIDIHISGKDNDAWLEQVLVVRKK